MNKDEREYFRAFEHSLTAIEGHMATAVSSLSRLRDTTHNLVSKTIVLDEVASSVAVISALAESQANMAKSQAAIASAVGRMNDMLEEAIKKLNDNSDDLRRRVEVLERRNA
jgi:methyl-accepting chemotaxis protein